MTAGYCGCSNGTDDATGTTRDGTMTGVGAEDTIMLPDDNMPMAKLGKPLPEMTHSESISIGFDSFQILLLCLMRKVIIMLNVYLLLHLVILYNVNHLTIKHYIYRHFNLVSKLILIQNLK